MVFQLTEKIVFPNPSLADADGLLAVGGDLSVERLLLAYSLGIFPWYSEGEPVLWYSPHQRFVLFPDKMHISRSMRRTINSTKYEIRWNTCFEQVITACATTRRKGQRGTWINDDMIQAYLRLHHINKAHSIEVWMDGVLSGGLYGVEVNGVFCAESMFSKAANTSKLALIALCQSRKYDLIDCQMFTPHLERMGATYMSRVEFMEKLRVRISK